MPEPGDGAHTDPDEAARLLGDALAESLEQLESQSGDELRRQRRVRFTHNRPGARNPLETAG